MTVEPRPAMPEQPKQIQRRRARSAVTPGRKTWLGWIYQCSSCGKASYLRWEYSSDTCPFCGAAGAFKQCEAAERANAEAGDE
jgi:rRNA maturation endonuclease Nob1